MHKFIVIFLCVLFLFSTGKAFAKIGVGVGTGKIQVTEQLKPGTIYQLPSLTVFNTGDVPSDYTVEVSYHEKQSQLRPSRSWFQFTPSNFHLAPGESQEVKIALNLPVRTEPGKYFAYLEGHPYAKSTNGNTTVGIAAAAKLYFTVVPGNIFEGIYYKILSIWKIYAPWPQIALGVLAIISIFLIIKKNVNIQIDFKKKKKEVKHKETESHEDNSSSN